MVVAADAARADSAVLQRLGAVPLRVEFLEPARLQPVRPAAVAVVSVERVVLLLFPLFLRTGFRSRLSATRDKESKAICRSSPGRPIS